jgi:hypothetical protein
MQHDAGPWERGEGDRSSDHPRIQFMARTYAAAASSRLAGRSWKLLMTTSVM